MPQAARFKAAFSMNVGDVLIGKFRVIKSSVGHIPLVQYRRYKYPFSVEIESDVEIRGGEVDRYLSKLVGVKSVINSEYGNPYECSIGAFTYRRLLEPSGEPSGKRFLIEGEAMCVRIFK